VIEELAVDQSRHRQVLLAELDDTWSWPFDLRVDWFVAFVAADATAASDERITALAEAMLEHNCAYACAWGPGCSRVHDLMDQTYLALPSHTWRGAEIARWSQEVPYLMTTWHDDESLAAALWYAHVSAYPVEDGYYVDRSTTFVALAAPEYLAEVRALLMDPERLNRESDDLIT